MYSDKWMSDTSLHKTAAVEINSATNIHYWVNEDEQLVGVCVHFELADDVHYELKADEWSRFLDEVLMAAPHSDYTVSLRKFLNASMPQVDFETALDAKNIEYKKISFYDF